MISAPRPTIPLGALLPGLEILPVRPGSLPFAEQARVEAGSGRFERIAVDLPSFCKEEFLEAVHLLPAIHAATWVQDGRRWVLPADPCDAATVACRSAMMEHLETVFLDDEAVPSIEEDPDLPDDSIVEILGGAEFSALSLPWMSRAVDAAMAERGRRMVRRLLSLPARPTLLVLRNALVPPVLASLARFALSGETDLQVPPEDLPEASRASQVERIPVEPRHLFLALGEWPWICQEVERLRSDPFGQIPPHRSWVARLYLFARRRHLSRSKAARVSPAALRTAVRFARRLARQGGRMDPDLWEAVQAAKACVGDAFAASVLESALFHGHDPVETHRLQLGRSRARILPEAPLPWSHRQRPRPLRWTTLKLRKEPDPEDAARWIREWRRESLCSHLPEDIAIERFHRSVRERAKSSSPSQRTRVRKFEASMLDGLDLRETVRNFWKGELWVKEHPARSLELDAAVIVFDDERDIEYPHRGTWYAEHRNESTLLFYATDPSRDPVGPGILRSRYGGLALLFPPLQVPDVFAARPSPLGASGCAETLVAGASLFARRSAIAYAAWSPPSLAVQDIARQAGKRLVYVPLSGFSPASLERLRTFHVLNGKDVRGWADAFIQGE